MTSPDPARNPFNRQVEDIDTVRMERDTAIALRKTFQHEVVVVRAKLIRAEQDRDALQAQLRDHPDVTAIRDEAQRLTGDAVMTIARTATEKQNALKAEINGLRLSNVALAEKAS